ncbi:T9SS type B sorting domain-containing protein [Apibacter raozihei]|uniref:T9SS type B sorting domain-containing protein n=1 Tax=Apibacter raozihei TaxID=2500547 RepID=UPI000FE2F67D|nr:T9SS type B sorting domain-containing protein [Apibacter raozihei]
MQISSRLFFLILLLALLTSKQLYSQRDISLVNGGFESPSFNSLDVHFLHQNSVPGWLTTAGDKMIEIWTLGGVSSEVVYSVEGKQHAELNANMVSTLYQVLNTEPGKKMRWSLYHRGRRGTDEMELRIGSSLNSYVIVQDKISTGRSWKLYKGTYTVPFGQTNSYFMFASISAAGGNPTVGNFLDDVRFSYTSELTLTKSASSTVVTNGDVITITIDVKNVGGTSTEQTLVTDKIPEGTVYQAGSLIVDGLAQTDANDNDKAYITGTNLNYKLDKIAKGGNTVISFKVKILNCEKLVTSPEAVATYFDEFFTDEQYTSKSNQVTIQPVMKPISLEIIYPSCPNGSATLNIGIQPKDYTIIWTMPDGSTMSGSNSSIIVNESGIYKVLVKFPQNCESSVSKQVTIQKGLIVNLGSDRSICQGSTTTLDAGNTGSTYLWSTGATTQSIEVNQAGTYSVVVTDANGCQGSGSVKVTVNALPVVNLGADRSICQGSSTTLDAGNAGSTYLWSTGATTRSIEVTQAGTYSVVVTDANGCQGSGSVKVTVNALPVVNLGADRSICQGSTTVLDAGNPGSTYLWSTGATTQSIEVTQAGTYSVVVTDTNGCQGSGSVKVTVNALPVVNLGADRSICQGSTTVLDAGNAGSTYLWSTGATTQSIEVTQAGTYSVVVTDANGCQGKGSIKITVNALPVVNLGADRSICQGSTTVLDAGNTGSTYLWSTGATTRSIEVTQAGTYSVVVTDANGCQGSGSVKVTVNALPVVNLGADRSICQGSSTTLDAGNAGSTYLWSTGATTRSIEVTQAGTYSVVVTDANGCQGSGSVKVTVNALPVVNLGADRSICQGSTTVLDAGNTGSTYLWSTGATTQSIEVTQAGTYSVVVTDTNGCQGSGSVKVTVNALPVVNLGADRSICQGSTTVLDAGNAGSTYLWSTGATTQSIEVTQAGTYSVVVTDANGCQGKGSIKITVNALPVVNLGADRSICQGSTTVLDAGNTGSTYLWSTGATTRSIEVTQAGTYSVVVTDTNGCQGSGSVKVTVNALPVVNLGADRSICQGNTTVLDAGNPGSTYLWSTGATTQSIEVTQAGTYSVVVTDANGCQGKGSIKITVNALPVVNLGADRSICQGSSTTLDAGNTGSSYLWSTGATTRSIEVTQAGTYSVVVTDTNGCQGSGSVKVTVNALPLVNLGADRSICQGSSTTLDAGNAGSTYLWSTGATTRSIEVTQAGTYSVVVTDANGCQGSGSVKVTVNALPVVNLGADRSICQGSSTTLDAGNAGSTYLWITGATTRSIEVTQAGTYSVVVTDANGCQGSDEIKISINPLPVVNLGADRSICQGSSTTLDAGNTGSSYLWSTGATTQSIEVTQAGTYSVVVTDVNGCQGSDEIKISINPLPVVNLGADRSICQGSSTTLDAGNTGSSYLWSTGATTQSIEVTQAATYSVVVTDANGCQGSDEIKITVNPLPVVNLGADRSICQGSSTTLDAGNTGSSYLWSTGATTQSIEVTQAGIYKVTVTNKNGCSSSSSIQINYYETPQIKEIKINGNDVEVYAIGKAPLEYSLDLINWQSSPFFTGLKPKIYHAYVRNALGCINGPLVFSILDIPNIITPNGDGINDVWHIKGLEIYSGSSITIFDRYGKLLLKQKIDKEFIWDGKYLGRNLPSSSYWYILDLTDGRRLTGWIAIRNHDSIR